MRYAARLVYLVVSWLFEVACSLQRLLTPYYNKLLVCSGHTVCGNCLQQLLRRQARCPFCRVSVFRGECGHLTATYDCCQA